MIHISWLSRAFASSQNFSTYALSLFFGIVPGYFRFAATNELAYQKASRKLKYMGDFNITPLCLNQHYHPQQDCWQPFGKSQVNKNEFVQSKFVRRPEAIYLKASQSKDSTPCVPTHWLSTYYAWVMCVCVMCASVLSCTFPFSPLLIFF